MVRVCSGSFSLRYCGMFQQLFSLLCCCKGVFQELFPRSGDPALAEHLTLSAFVAFTFPPCSACPRSTTVRALFHPTERETFQPAFQSSLSRSEEHPPQSVKISRFSSVDGRLGFRNEYGERAVAGSITRGHDFRVALR